MPGGEAKEVEVMSGMRTWEDVREQVELDDRNKWDMAVDANKLKMFDDGTFSIPGEEGPDLSDLGKPHEEQRVMVRPNDYALGQLCGRLEIPARYLRRLPSNLQAQLINHDLEKVENGNRRFMLRCKGSMIRAFLTEKYSRIDNREVLDIVSNLALQIDHQFREFYLDERGFWAKILLDDLRVWDPSHSSTELKLGLLIGNSEVGARSISIEPFIYRYACTNDMVIQEDKALHQRHMHLKTRELRLRVIEAVNDAIEGGDDVLDQFAKSVEEEVEHPSAVIARLAKKRGLSEKLRDQVKSSYEEEPNKTRFGIINAFTATARKLEGDNRVDLERFAGKLLAAKLPDYPLTDEEKAEAA